MSEHHLKEIEEIVEVHYGEFTDAWKECLG